MNVISVSKAVQSSFATRFLEYNRVSIQQETKTDSINDKDMPFYHEPVIDKKH